MHVRTFALAGITLLAGSALGQIVPSSGGYDFKLKYTKGQKIVYSSSTSLSQGGMKPFDMTISMLCTDVKNGVYTVKMNVGGLPGQKPTDVVVKMDNKGKIVGGSAAAKQAMGMGATNLPSKPIKIGESWKSSVDTAVAGATLKVNTTYTLKGMKSVGGKQVADIAISMSSTGSGMTMSGTGSLQLSAADANLVTMVMNMKMGAGGQTFDMKTTMKRK